jgi:hypothetical protein
MKEIKADIGIFMHYFFRFAPMRTFCNVALFYYLSGSFIYAKIKEENYLFREIKLLFLSYLFRLLRTCRRHNGLLHRHPTDVESSF